jgi:hypothetical protein
MKHCYLVFGESLKDQTEFSLDTAARRYTPRVSPGSLVSSHSLGAAISLSLKNSTVTKVRSRRVRANQIGRSFFAFDQICPDVGFLRFEDLVVLLYIGQRQESFALMKELYLVFARV